MFVAGAAITSRVLMHKNTDMRICRRSRLVTVLMENKAQADNGSKAGCEQCG